jgi:hypothetical protein
MPAEIEASEKGRALHRSIKQGAPSSRYGLAEVIMMRITIALAVMVLLLSASAFALDRQPYQIRDDYGMEPLSDCRLQYYYYTPCPTYSWFWAFTGWAPGDILGAWFQIGDVSTGGFDACDPAACHTLEQIRILDFGGYGQVHPGLFTVELDVYCADDFGCPVGPSLWNSGPVETGFAWNYVLVDPSLCLTGCAVDPGPPVSGPRILVTVSHVGTQGQYPAWGMDNISTHVEVGCELHDIGCLPILYPRPYTSHYPSMHSGYYGRWGFDYCPPVGFLDGNDTTPDGTEFGYVEVCWRLYLGCSGPTATQPATWSNIKSMYR